MTKREQARHLREQGKTIQYIADTLGLTKWTVTDYTRDITARMAGEKKPHSKDLKFAAEWDATRLKLLNATDLEKPENDVYELLSEWDRTTKWLLRRCGRVGNG